MKFIISESQAKKLINEMNVTPESFNREQMLKTGFWGEYGAGCIILAKNTGKLLIPFRSGSVREPNTWGTWGGAVDPGMSPIETVKKEVYEEAGYSGNIKLTPLYVYKHQSGFKYYNFLAIVDEEFEPTLNWETSNYGWFDLNEIPSNMHFGLQNLLSDKKSLNTIKRYVNEFKKISENKKNIKNTLNEIRLTPIKSDYHILKKNSKEVDGVTDYSVTFKSKSNKLYVIDIDGYIDKKSPFPEELLYNIAFSSLENSRAYEDYDYEAKTYRNEMLDVMARIMYVIIEIKKMIRANFKPIFVIGETSNPQKINIYRNIIKNSLPNFKEYHGKSSVFGGVNAYYYY